MKICPQCNSQNEDEFIFCTVCGSKFNEESNKDSFKEDYKPQPEAKNYQNKQNNYKPTNGPKGKAIAALVLGIVGIVTFFIPYFNTISLIISILGIIFAVGARNDSELDYDSRKLATAGLVCAIIGTVFSGIGFFYCTLCISCLSCGAAGYYPFY